MFDLLNTVVYANPEGAAPVAADPQMAAGSGMFSLIWIILMIAQSLYTLRNIEIY